MFIRIETASGVPITRQIADQIRMQYAAGVLRAGDRLPSVRVLARELAVNQNTILRVYERLTMEGLLERRHGDGTYVAPRPPAGQLEVQQDLLAGEVERLVRRAATLGMKADDLGEMIGPAFERLEGEPGQSKGTQT